MGGIQESLKIQLISVISKQMCNVTPQLYFFSRISPIGIGSVICAKILSVEDLAEVMSQLAWFIITVVGGIFLYQFTILQLIYFIFVRKNPFVFWAGLFQTWMTSFATASTWVPVFPWTMFSTSRTKLTGANFIFIQTGCSNQ